MHFKSLVAFYVLLTIMACPLLASAQDQVFDDGFENNILAFESVPLSVAFKDSPYSYQPLVSIPVGPQLSFSLVDAPPAGMAIDPATGRVNWIPSALGDFRVAIEATHRGRALRQIWTVRVALPTPSFSMVNHGWTFTEATPWSQSATFVNDSPVMDVDQDGLPDIVYGGPLWDNGWVNQAVPFRWLRNNGDGTFGQGNQSLIPASSALVHARHMEVEDFNQDGLDDLVAVSHGFDVPPFPMERNLILKSRVGQSLVDSELNNPDFNYAGFSHGLATGDVNGDGAKDIVMVDLFTATGLLQDKLRIMINAGTGEFNRSTSALQINEQTGVLDVALIDLSGDGADELVFGSWRDGQQSQIFWNNGSGSFSQSYTVLPKMLVNGLAQYDTLAIASTDLNFDGLPDLILSVSREYQNGYLQFLLNNGDRTFSDATSQYSPGEVYYKPGYWIHVEDFNGDTLDDLLIGVSANPFDNSNVNNLLLRSANGKFQKYAVPLNEFNDWGDAWPIDYDLDGDTDLVFRYPRRFFEGYIPSPRWRTVKNTLINLN